MAFLHIVDIKALIQEFDFRLLPAVQMFDITKRFVELTAVDEINLSIDSAEIFGMLVPNGAGKTTLIRMLPTVLRPTEGTAKVAGVDIVVATAAFGLAV